jgi:5-methylcytosine-specific restriction protein A
LSRLYDLQAWRRCSRAYLRAHPLCVLCKAEGKIRIATQVDHIVTLKNGGDPWSWENIQPLCVRHYVTKTLITEQDKLPKGGNGTPLDPQRWWNR